MWPGLGRLPALLPSRVAFGLCLLMTSSRGSPRMWPGCGALTAPLYFSPSLLVAMLGVVSVPLSSCCRTCLYCMHLSSLPWSLFVPVSLCLSVLCLPVSDTLS